VTQDLDENLALYEMRSEEEQINQSLFQERLFARLTIFFGALATLLASVGVYGIMAFNATQRTHEIGIRMALGAERRDVLRMILGEGAKMAVLGVAIGLVAAFGLTRLMANMLFGVTPTDPLTFGAASLLLLAVALLAVYIPARRATKVDPMVALRYE
jgi:putative ABC transport system permease protein